MTTKRDSSRAAAVTLIGFGVLFLLAQVFNFSFLGVFWPLIIVMFGLPFLIAAVSGSRAASGLIIPGAMISGTGAILFYQNLSGHWESWAYAWVLYIALLGASLIFIGNRTEDERTVSAGKGFLQWGLAGFAGLWALFELVIFGGNTLLGQLLLPILLIGAGGWLLIRRQAGAPEKPKIALAGRDRRAGTKAKRRLTPSEELQLRIDAALAEPDSRDAAPADSAPTAQHAG